MARVACSPALWGPTRYELFLDDAAGAGYTGVEAHATALEAFAGPAGRLRGFLEERLLTLTAAPFSGVYFERDEWKDELERLRRVADSLGEASAEGTVLFRTVPHPARRDMVAGQPQLLPLDGNRVGHLAETLNRYADVCAGFGLKAALVNRVGSYVEAPDELEAVLERTEPGLIWLAPDLGHWTYAGGDPASLVRRYQERIVSPRLKDFDRAVFDQVAAQRLGFASFVRAGGFKELGAGSLDLVTTLLPLEEAAYDGWVCVEQELTETTPRESATVSRDYLKEHLHW